MKSRLRSIFERVGGYVLIVAAVAFFVFFYTHNNRVQKKSIEEMRTKILGLRETLAKAQTDLGERQKKFTAIKSDLAALQEKVKTNFNDLLTKQADYTNFIRDVELKAQALQIRIQNSTYQAPAKAATGPSEYLEFRFTVNVSGLYEKMKQFLWELENSLGRFVKIDKMTIKAPLCDAEGSMNLTLTLSTYFLP